MKKIRNVLFTILMFLIVYIIYDNIDIITTRVRDLLINNNEPSKVTKNAYTRSYNYINFNYNEEYIPYNKEDIINIYFNILNNGEKEFTFYCPSEYKTCTEDIISIGKDNTLMSNINNYVHPFNSFESISTKVSSLGNVTIYINYKYSKEKINEINSKVDLIFKSLELDGLSNKEKLEKIHDYIIENTKYDNESETSSYDSTSSYGTLIEGYAVCSGYSDTMAIFLDRLNIPNLKVSSKNHIWNLVYLGNKWLHLDLTWDDSGDDKYNNNYFLITKEKLFELDSKEHMFDESFFVEAR